MHALVLTAAMRLEMLEVPDPVAETGHVVVRVRACGICGSDVHGMDGSTGRRKPPIIMGHEATGTIVDVGASVARWKVGDRVTFDSTVYCGECAYCRAGRINLCERRRVLGVSCDDYARDGAFAELVSVPQHILYPIPDHVSFQHAAMIEPISIAVHAVSRVTLADDATVVVIGAGMIGLLVIQVLRAGGCRHIIAADISTERLALASRMGATATVCTGAGDVVREAKDHTNGRGADIAFEAVGGAATVQAAVESVRKGGAVVLIGNLAPEVPFPLQSVVTGELSVLGSCASCGEYPECLELLAAGAIDVAPLISAVAPLREGPAWFDRLYRREPGLMKVILEP
jgi:L-iditol 2-dehydrogenase